MTHRGAGLLWIAACLFALHPARAEGQTLSYAEAQTLLENARGGTLETPERLIQVPSGLFSSEESVSEGISWVDYIRERLHVAFGYDLQVTDNLLLEEEDPFHELISTPEAEILFADPRGDLLYGAQYENNSTYYHRLATWGFSHDAKLFFDVTPKARYQYGATYRIDITESPTIAGEDFDDVRRNANELFRVVQHAGVVKFKYDLNPTNSLRPELSYVNRDDQTNVDAGQDRRTFAARVDWDHDLTPLWTIFGGYEYEDLNILHDKTKDTQTHSGRVGFKYKASELSKADFLMKIGQGSFGSGQSTDELEFAFNWDRQLSERTKMTVSYQDNKTASFLAGRETFRSYGPGIEMKHQLTPLISVNPKLSWRRHLTEGSTTGASAADVEREFYRAKVEFEWKLADGTKMTAGYDFLRSFGNTAGTDYEENRILFGFEREL